MFEFDARGIGDVHELRQITRFVRARRGLAEEPERNAKQDYEWE